MNSLNSPNKKDPNITVPVFCHLYFERPSDQKVSDKVSSVTYDTSIMTIGDKRQIVLKVTLMYVPDSQKETGGSGYRALVENGSQNPAQKETEAWWSKKVK